MSIRRSSASRRLRTAPKDTFLSNVLGQYLDPIDAVSTIFFSILFALLFTLTYGILIQRGVIDRTFATGYGQELFVSILVAVTAWGIVDGVVYLLTSVFARNERIRLLHTIQTSDDDEKAVWAVADELDFILEPITSDAQREELYQDILKHMQIATPQTQGLHREDLTGATATVLLSVAAVQPSLLPLLLLDDTAQASRQL